MTNDTFNTYTWDAEGKLLSEEGYTFIYDAFGHEAEWLSSGTYELSYITIGNYKLSAMGQSPWYAEYPYPGGSLTSEGAGLTAAQMADWLGTSRAIYTYSGGNWIKSIAHAPFGETYVGNSQNFTGQWSDADTVNTTYFFPERQYRSSQGRWLSPDPAGVQAADPSNPQSWNRYAYVLNNPLGYRDPTGLDRCVDSDGDTFEDKDGGDNDINCKDAGGEWVVEALDVGANANANVSQVPTETSSLNVYNFGTFLGTMTPYNLKLGFYGTQQARFNACVAPWAPPQNIANAPAINPMLSRQALAQISRVDSPVDGTNHPQEGPNGTVYFSRPSWDTGGANQVNANYGTFAHETANILDAKKNGQNGNYEKNYGSPNDPRTEGDHDTGAAAEVCMFGSLQRP